LSGIFLIELLIQNRPPGGPVYASPAAGLSDWSLFSCQKKYPKNGHLGQVSGFGAHSPIRVILYRSMGGSISTGKRAADQRCLSISMYKWFIGALSIKESLSIIEQGSEKFHRSAPSRAFNDWTVMYKL
jgi:hypothetical protein